MWNGEVHMQILRAEASQPSGVGGHYAAEFDFQIYARRNRQRVKGSGAGIPRQDLLLRRGFRCEPIIVSIQKTA